MIDVTFLLIVFFVLVSQIVEREHVEMRLPELSDPATVPLAEEGRVVLNVLPGEGGDAAGLRLAGETFAASEAGRDALAERLAGMLRRDPGLDVQLRADRATRYRAVAPVLDAVRRAGTLAGVKLPPRLNLVVVPGEEVAP